MAQEVYTNGPLPVEVVKGTMSIGDVGCSAFLLVATAVFFLLQALYGIRVQLADINKNIIALQKVQKQ